MAKNLDCHRTLTDAVADDAAPQAGPMRTHLEAFVDGLAGGTTPLRLPRLPGRGVLRGEGHFHLAAELFLQVSGWTQFRFPHGELRLHAGEALLMPPRLLHFERIGASTPGEPFRNLVIYADDRALTCHLAHESEPGKPGILHLEARRHAQFARMQDWLYDAAQLGPLGAGAADDAAPPAAAVWAMAQARALVLAATAGVLRALGDADADVGPEPALVARLRVLIQNQLGDPRLSVQRLAEQCGYSADYLSHLFSQASGEHLIAFVNRQRMERAARLLAESEMAGKEIAWACGFATQSYFIRTFRAHFGVTPKAWRAGRMRPA